MFPGSNSWTVWDKVIKLHRLILRATNKNNSCLFFWGFFVFCFFVCLFFCCFFFLFFCFFFFFFFVCFFVCFFVFFFFFFFFFVVFFFFFCFFFLFFFFVVCFFLFLSNLPLVKMMSSAWLLKNKVREKSRECHNHKPQPFLDPKRKRKLTNPNKQKPNKRTKSTKISSLFPKRGYRITKRTEKHKNKMTHGKTYNKSPRRINHKPTIRLTPGPPP